MIFEIPLYSSTYSYLNIKQINELEFSNNYDHFIDLSSTGDPFKMEEGHIDRVSWILSDPSPDFFVFTGSKKKICAYSIEDIKRYDPNSYMDKLPEEIISFVCFYNRESKIDNIID